MYFETIFLDIDWLGQNRAIYQNGRSSASSFASANWFAAGAAGASPNGEFGIDDELPGA